MLISLVVSNSPCILATLGLYLACVNAAGYAAAKQTTLTALILESEKQVLMEFLGVNILKRPDLLGIAALSCLLLAT